MSAIQHKTYFINRKKRDEIRYHHGLNEGIIYGNQTTSRLFLVDGKNVCRAISFLFRPVISTMTIIIDCHANHQPEYRPFGKAILRHFSWECKVHRINVLVRGLGVSLSLFSQWACSTLVCGGNFAGFFPKVSSRLPLLRNFRNMRKRL